MARDKIPDWADELGEVRPLEDRDTRAPRTSKPKPTALHEPAVDFEIESDGETLAGRAPGVAREELRRLRRGERAIETRVDLHGLRAAEAERLLRERLLEADAAGRRVVLVVHGRGLHSEQEAVLKQALPGWLAAAPLGPRVLAFATAAPRDGGSGATYVLLRRARP